MMTLEQILEDIKSPRVKKCILDSDMYNEVDDQYAIAYMLRSPERVNLKAIYAAPFSNPKSQYKGGIGMELSYNEIKRILTLVKKDTPVYRGSNRLPSVWTDAGKWPRLSPESAPRSLRRKVCRL